MNTQRKTLIGLATSLFYGFLTVSFASAATEGGSEESSCSFVNGSVRFSFVSKATESATLSGSDSISISCTVGVSVVVSAFRVGQTVSSRGTSYELVGESGESDVNGGVKVCHWGGAKVGQFV